MAPLKSSLARSAKKLLGVFRREDLDLRGQVDSTRFVPPKNHYTITPPGGSAVTYDARSEKFSTMTAGEYTMVVLPNSEPFPAPVVLIGGGGDGWDGQGGRSGGAGGRTSATATFKQGNTYKVIVGSSGPEPAPTRFGGPGQNQAPAGGFTGIFYNSVTFANSALIAGGGGGSGRGPENPPSGGGGGGGGTTGGGNGGSQTAAGTPTGPNGGQLQGAGGFGGGGGGGYYGGGRGSDLGPYASQGGGGSGYVGGHPELPVTSTSTTQGGSNGGTIPAPSLLTTPTHRSGAAGGNGPPTATGAYNAGPSSKSPYGYDGGIVIGNSPPGMENA